MDLAPKSLFYRFLLIIALPVVILQVISTYIFYERHWDAVSQRMRDSLVAEIKVMNSLLATSSAKEVEAIASSLNYKFTLYHDKKIDQFAMKHSLRVDLKFGELNDDLKKNFPNAVYKVLASGDVTIYIPLKKGIAAYEFTAKRILSPTTWIFIAWMVGSSLLLVLIAVVFMKNQVRPILNLAAVAEEFGKGREVGIYKPSGASEVRKVGQAFINMKKRIYRQINYRTELLNHISHDLRTPLTRLSLTATMLKGEPSRDAIIEEVDYMKNMINSYLNFAKDEGNEETLPHNIVLLVKDLVMNFKSPKVELICKRQKIEFKFRKDSMRRALSNLVDNAIKYSKGKVLIRMRKLSEYVLIIIEDDGKGIHKSYHKDVFKPFFKLDNKTESFGLGLSSVKSIIYSHGGSIKLAKSSTLGGLKIILKIPL